VLAAARYNRHHRAPGRDFGDVGGGEAVECVPEVGSAFSNVSIREIIDAMKNDLLYYVYVSFLFHLPRVQHAPSPVYSPSVSAPQKVHYLRRSSNAQMV
jgi:hypothetical protein